MPEILTVAEAGRRGGQARARSLTPKRRREIALAAHLAGAVNTIARRSDDLTKEQKDLLFQALYGPDAA